jgi:fructokinase
MTKIACVGEALLDLFADEGESDLGASERFRRAAGGAVSNVAIGIARLGGDVDFIGTVGRDPFGRFLARTLAEAGVDVSAVRVVDEQTAVMFVARGPNGARDFLPTDVPGAHTMLTVDDVGRAALERAGAVHLGGYMLAREPARSATLAAARIGLASGIVSFDPNVRPRGFADETAMRRDILSTCASAHLVKASSEDLGALGLRSDDPAVLLRGATTAAIVTLGADGCLWATVGGGAGSESAPRFDIVDTTGAGDAFMAALLWRIVETHGCRLGPDAIGDSVKFAVAAGALACTKVGAVASLPNADELASAVGRMAASRN